MKFLLSLALFFSAVFASMDFFETASDETVNSRQKRQGSDGFLDFLYAKRYDRRERPRLVGTNGTIEAGPTFVGVSIFVGSIRSVSEVTMDYSLELFYREYWRDPRLEWDLGNRSELSLHESYAEFIWKPDTFFPNAIKSQNPKEKSITHRSLVRLRPGGHILYSRRISVTAECPMDLTLFPFDRQMCKLGLESYGYPNTEIQYTWKGVEPVQYGIIQLPDFTLTSVRTSSRNFSYETGTYSRLHACFVFARSAGFCFLQLIIPATAVVITSWVSLWLENETSFQDMIAIILTITFLIFSYNTVMPRVSYIKAMDIYLGACFFFVFISLIRLAIVKFMRQKMMVMRDPSIFAINGMGIPIVGSPSHEPLSPKCNGTDPEVPVVSGPAPQQFRNRNHTAETLWRWRCMRTFHIVTKFLFPLAFVAFCIFYFVGYPRIYDSVDSTEC